MAVAMDPVGASRILVYGVTGSGKSTLAGKISAATGLRYHPVDDLTWEPNWVEVPHNEQRRRMTEICAQDEWILDSAYGKWLDIPIARAQLIVGLDYPRWRSLGRLVRRTAIRLVDRQVVCNGNRESLRTLLGSDSIVAWHFRSFQRKRGRIRAWAADPKGPAVLRLTKPAQADQLLDQLCSTQAQK